MLRFVHFDQEAASIIQAALPEGDTDKALLQDESSQMLNEDDDIENEMVDSSLPTNADTIDNILEPRKNKMIERELRMDEEVTRFPLGNFVFLSLDEVLAN